MFKRFKSLALSALVLVVASQLVACGSPWKVLRQAKPKPFDKTTPLAVDNTFYRGLQVNGMPEDTHTQKLNPEEKKQWKSDKTFFSETFRKATRAASSGIAMGARVTPKSYIVKPNVIRVSGGDGSDKMKVTLRIRIERKGSIFDLIEVKVEVGNGEAPNFSKRFRVAAQKAGEITAKYLKQRMN